MDLFSHPGHGRFGAAQWTLSIKIRIENQDIHIFYVLGSWIQVDVERIFHLWYKI